METYRNARGLRLITLGVATRQRAAIVVGEFLAITKCFSRGWKPTFPGGIDMRDFNQTGAPTAVEDYAVESVAAAL